MKKWNLTNPNFMETIRQGIIKAKKLQGKDTILRRKKRDYATI